MNKISNVIIVAGIVLLLGTAGASDFNRGIEFSQILHQAAAGVGIIIIGSVMKYITGGIEE